jgi:hypothetical protein
VSARRAAVVIATRQRPIRLRWLLNALAEQTFPPQDFEVIVAYDPACPESVRVLDEHPLRRDGRLRAVPAPPARQHPGAMRNLAWPESAAPLILFTDDDCRPVPEWIEQAAATAGGDQDVIVQGMTLPDPDESAVADAAPWVRTLDVIPPTAWTETCNIAYPRALLARLGGFDEAMRVGEDTDLGIRARQAGARLVPVPGMLCYHAVEEESLLAIVRATARWRDLALLAKRHPSVRRHMWGLMWWKPQHAALLAAAAGAGLAARRREAAALALPWLRVALRQRGYGYHPRALARGASELAGRALIDAGEVVALARGSVRYRTLLL